MVARHMTALFVVPFVLEAAPLNESAMTACARSRPMFLTGIGMKTQRPKNMTSINTTVAIDGAPPVPSKRAWKLGITTAEGESFGRYVVMTAKRKSTAKRTGEESCSRRMSMAMTSR